MFENALEFFLYALGVTFLTLSFKIIWNTIKS